MRARRSGSNGPRGWPALGLVSASLAFGGCGTPAITIPGGVETGRVFYADGAGGGSRSMGDWGVELRRTLKACGQGLAVEDFPWQSGLGPLWDQQLSCEDKQDRAKALAEVIRQYREISPSQPVHLVGFSAGTMIIVYALEQLPEGCQVETVVLLGSSISAGYDLTAALRHVRTRMHVFTSEKDAVLTGLVPLTGTADRVYCGRDITGVTGFRLPADADEATRGLYEKVVMIPWQPDFAAFDNHGGHTDVVKGRFVQAYLTPLLLTDAFGELAANRPADSIERRRSPVPLAMARKKPPSDAVAVSVGQ